MKYLSISLFWILSISSRAKAFDYKECVLEKVDMYISKEDSCSIDKLKGTTAVVTPAYSQCSRELTLDTPNLTLQAMQENANANYDSEIEKKIIQKISSCKYTGYVEINNKGKSPIIQVFEIKYTHKENPERHRVQPASI
jgi:hypothetical protein